MRRIVLWCLIIASTSAVAAVIPQAWGVFLFDAISIALVGFLIVSFALHVALVVVVLLLQQVKDFRKRKRTGSGI